jgi:hypothetical protein
MALNPQIWAVRAAAAALPYVLVASLAGGLAAAGAWHLQGQRWQALYDREALHRAGEKALAEAAAEAVREAQRDEADGASLRHAMELKSINEQLGGAHAHIAELSDRQCLGAGTVRVLNRIAPGSSSSGDVRAAAGNPSSAAPTPSPAADDAAQDEFASERDVAEFIAACRAQYGEVSSQVNQILDIEDARHAGGR